MLFSVEGSPTVDQFDIVISQCPTTVVCFIFILRLNKSGEVLGIASSGRQ